MAGAASTAGTGAEGGAGLGGVLPGAGALAGEGTGAAEGATISGGIWEGLEEFGALVVEDGGLLLLMSYKYQTPPHVEPWRALVRHDEHRPGVTAIHQRIKART
jgi:hypothetical protein